MRKTNLVSCSGFINLLLAVVMLALLVASNLTFGDYHEIGVSNLILLFLIGGTYGYGLKETNNKRLRDALITIPLLIISTSVLGILLGIVLGIIEWVPQGYFYCFPEVTFIGFWLGRLFSSNYQVW